MRKFINVIKVKCLNCGVIYWKESLNNNNKCFCCKIGEVRENMNSNFDYDHKRELELNLNNE